jgi:dTDP-4-dehydrorhamnose 3,5-epimerase
MNLNPELCNLDGIYVLSEEAEVYYKCSDFYSLEHERCIRWDDLDLAIDWPSEKPILSEKDRQATFFKDAVVSEE